MSAPRPHIYDVHAIDLSKLGVPICKNIDKYAQARTGCYYDYHDAWDVEGEIRKASRCLSEELPPKVLLARTLEFAEAADFLEVALRYVIVCSCLILSTHPITPPWHCIGISPDAEL